MNKITTVATILLGCSISTTFAADLTQKQMEMVARCNDYLHHYPSLTNMPPKVAEAAQPYLEFCYQNHTCTDENCTRQLNLWKLNPPLSASETVTTTATPSSNIPADLQKPLENPPQLPTAATVTPNETPTASQSTGSNTMNNAANTNTPPQSTPAQPQSQQAQPQAQPQQQTQPTKQSINWF